MSAFTRFFEKGTRWKPYPYQERMGMAKVFPKILSVPTGAGKTQAALVSWLYRRREHPDPEVRTSTPRRLIYCLPMRVLVEQTCDVAKQVLRALGWRHDGDPFEAPASTVGLYQLMGGDVDDDWYLWPERDAILVGTQDMLLSRALNRGYGESRYRWPRSFGLLNSDALWILDEVQLMGVGLPTSCQLQAFRDSWRTFGPAHTLWMSATASPGVLRTVDHPAPGEAFGLEPEDRTHEALEKRLSAKKRLRRAETALRATDKNESAAYAASLASEVQKAHLAGTLSLVIMNTVGRARELYRKLAAPVLEKRAEGKKSVAVANSPEVMLLHSRFRPGDRRKKLEQLLAPLPATGRIVVSTQVLEAGVDISARTLFTELAPWPSLVQRFGRCNRAGEFKEVNVLWVDAAGDGDAKLALPYDQLLLADARNKLKKMDAVGPRELEALGSIELPEEKGHVLRRRDLWELFDTTADVSGADLDVSLFVRDTEDHSLQVFWRDLPATGAPLSPPRDLPRPQRDELCSAGILEARALLEKTRKGSVGNGWTWHPIDGEWKRIETRRLRPGLLVLLRSDLGGYSTELGFDADEDVAVPPVGPPPGLPPEEGADDDPPSFQRIWLPLKTHLDDVEREATAIASSLEPVLDDPRWRVACARAGRWHDAGKAHEAFQDTLLRGACDDAERAMRRTVTWAKSGGRMVRHAMRPRFRHELASSLALLAGAGDALEDLPREDRDLVIYLVAAHHGRVRLGIRAVEDEKAPPEPDRRFALGVWQDDRLPATDLGGGHRILETVLDLSPMELGEGPDGRASWTQRMIAQLQRLGPFRLAYLEALVIAADHRASAMAERKEAGRV